MRGTRLEQVEELCARLRDAERDRDRLRDERDWLEEVLAVTRRRLDEALGVEECPECLGSRTLFGLGLGDERWECACPWCAGEEGSDGRG